MLAHAQHLAHYDPLTGLCNRVLFGELVLRELAVAQRSGESFAILAIDLDGFKAVNDRHGHAAGDTVLKEAADRMARAIRVSDVAARQGGDEFAVLLLGAGGDDATGVAEALVESL
ncbi:GGDEF domain-containing protein, partial [Achromobacter xylosoxidans]